MSNKQNMLHIKNCYVLKAVAAVTACGHIQWVGSTEPCFEQCTSKYPCGGGLLLGADFVMEKIGNLLSVESLYYFYFGSLHSSHGIEVQVFSAENIWFINCISSTQEIPQHSSSWQLSYLPL